MDIVLTREQGDAVAATAWARHVAAERVRAGVTATRYPLTLSDRLAFGHERLLAGVSPGALALRLGWPS